MLFFWRPRRAKDFGAHIAPLSTAFGTVTANTTTRFGLGSVSDKDDTAASPGNLAYVDEVFAAARTIPADSDGTVLLNILKYDASANADVTLVGSYSLEGLTAGESERLPFDSGVTDAQRTLDFGDFLHFTIVNNSAAIDTQAAGGAVTVKLKYLT